MSNAVAVAFTNSAIPVLRRIHATKRNAPRNMPITKVTIHHAAGVINNANLLAWGHDPRCGASWNYGVGNDGGSHQMIWESDRAWTSSSAWNDNQAITIEVGNSGVGPNWTIGAPAWDTTVRLVVDIIRRNPGIRRRDGRPGLYFDNTRNASLTFHDMFTATTCPGPWFRQRAVQFCNEVNRLLDCTGVVHPPVVPILPALRVNDIVNFTGNRHFGSSIAATPGTAVIRPGNARITHISNGRNPYHLVGVPNGSTVHGWVPSDQVQRINIPVSPPIPNRTITQVAREVLRGVWGNGVDRTNRLRAAGYDPVAVQIEVNRLLNL